MSDRPATERANPASARLEQMTARELCELMNAEDARVAPAVAAELPAIASAIDEIARRLREGGRLVYLGAGTSGRLGVLDASECPPTFGVPPEQVVGLIAGGERALVRAQEGAEDRADLAAADLDRSELSARDALVAISASGRTPYVLAGVEHAHEIGALTIGVTCDRDSPLARAARIAIAPDAGPEILAGSTRLKAGTATKLVLNMLSTGAMVRLGRVSGNLMADLRPGSAKLAQRAAGIVAQLASVSEARAQELLAEHGGSVRAAVAEAERPPLRAQAKREGETPEPRGGLVLGCDGGGTRTRVALATVDPPAAILGEGEAGACNLATDFDAAVASIESAIELAFAEAGRTRERVSALAVACAGSGDAGLRERLRAALSARGIARRIVVVHDAAPLLVGGTPDGIGVALIAGTGSFAFGRDAEGRRARAGGLGPVLGDEGSAFALAHAALTVAVRTADGRGVEGSLARRIWERVGTREARALSDWANRALKEPARIAALAPIVSAAAAEGDAVAERILTRAANELALMAKTVVRALHLDHDALPVVLGGGVFDHDPAQVRRVVSAMRSLGVNPDVQPAVRALEGAVAIARALAADRFDERDWH